MRGALTPALAILVTTALGACGGSSVDPPSPAPVPGPAPAVIPEARRCGEPGAVATALPDGLRDEMREAGDATVTPGATVEVGGVTARYDAHAWIGNRESGSRGPALSLVIDRAEVGAHEPWGDQVELSAGTSRRVFVGPHRVDVQASGEDPPASVLLHVERRGCPDHTVTADPALPLSMWLSTEAIRQHTLQDARGMLQVAIDPRPGAAAIEVRQGLWRHVIELRPGVSRAVRVDGRIVTLDAVEPGRDTVFEGGAWRSSAGALRVHARVRVEPAGNDPARPAAIEPSTCGAPASAPSALPAELRQAPRGAREITLTDGEQRVLEGIELTARTLEQPARSRHDRPARILSVSSPAMQPSSIALGTTRGPWIARADRALLAVELAEGTERARVRALPLACAGRSTIPAITAPTYVWLGTTGHTEVVIGPESAPTLTLQLWIDPRSPTLAARSEHANDSQTLAPAVVGHSATMDELRIEIVDVVAGEGTRPATPGWETDGIVPVVAVLVRIAPDA